MTRFWKILAVLAFAVVPASSSFAQILAPQGRLTLTSNTPVMTSDVVGATTLYYTPYVGNSLLISNGTSLSNQTFSQLSMSISYLGPHGGGGLYDVYAIYVSGAFKLCIANTFSNLSNRDPGLGLTMLQGIWVNASTLTNFCETASTNYTVPANQGVYLGSIYTGIQPHDSDLGLTVQFTPAAALGGSGTLIGIWNAYNRVRVTTSSQDSTPSWTDATTSWHDANNSALNSISWIDGLAQTAVSVAYDATATSNSSTGRVNVGVGINAIATPEVNPQIQNNPAYLTMHAATMSPPILGLNTTNAIVLVGSGTETFYGNSLNLLTLETDY